MSGEGGDSARRAAEAVARRSYGRLVAFLAARTRDVAAAEDALSAAFTRALTDWPARGIPQNPEAWLLTVARRQAIDTVRHKEVGERAGDHLALIADELEAAGNNEVPDQRLLLMFACAHPAIDPSVRAPLILQTILGFDAATIASAFLVAPSTMGQRLVRAKTKIRQAGIPFRLPDRDELPERLDSVLDAIYAVFAEGWTDPAGAEARRRDLAEEAIFLGRLVASLMRSEPEALGLLSLMLSAEARRAARRSAGGEYVTLGDQDTALWDAAMIDEAERLLLHASEKGRIGRFQLEAAIQSAHVVRRLTGRTDWAAIVKLYDALYEMTESPVVAINRAVAIAETRGAAEALAKLEAHGRDQRLSEYQPYWAARADFLSALGDTLAAAEAYRMAIGLESDPAVRRFLQDRLARLGVGRT
jgi:RNA polymerase sigma-70 factor (ECF subfamily)